jgi:hypothetical protein
VAGARERPRDSQPNNTGTDDKKLHETIRNEPTLICSPHLRATHIRACVIASRFFLFHLEKSIAHAQVDFERRSPG